MTEGIGERGLVVYQGDTSGVFISPDIQEGDRVVLYPLKDATRIAVPILSLSVGDCVFTSPEFKFAGFDWKLDFNFSLIPLVLNWIYAPAGTYYLNAIVEYSTTYSPDLITNALGAPDGQITYIGKDGWFIAEISIPNGTMIPNNGRITIWEKTDAISQWSFTNLYDYISSPWVSPTTGAGETYHVWIQLPNKIKVLCNCTHNIGPGNIDAIALTIT